MTATVTPIEEAPSYQESLEPAPRRDAYRLPKTLRQQIRHENTLAGLSTLMEQRNKRLSAGSTAVRTAPPRMLPAQAA